MGARSGSPVRARGGWRVTHGGVRIARPGYATQFSIAENPISEGARWANGLAVGADWSDIQVVGGKAYGTQSGPVSPPYDDSCAYLLPPAGRTWPRDQEIEAQVGIDESARTSTWTGFHEHLLLLRGSLASGDNKCIEALFPATGSHPLEMVQWKGPLGANGGGAFAGNPNTFCKLAEQASWPGTNDGDWIKASIVGNRVRMWHKTASASSYGNPYLDFLIGTDAVHTGTLGPLLAVGNPGFGHWKNGNGNLSDHWFRSWAFIGLL